MQNQEDARGDIVLIERIVARDEAAVAELYDRHCRLLFGLVLRIIRDRSEAEEILQEVFVLVWTRAETYNVSLGPPAAWLVRIARNRAIDRLRANNVRLRAVESAPEPEPRTRIDASGERSIFAPSISQPASAALFVSGVSERQRAVARALESLPPNQRVLIEQAYFQGLTQSELAERFKLPLGTVKTRIRTGMLALREQLSQVFIAQ